MGIVSQIVINISMKNVIYCMKPVFNGNIVTYANCNDIRILKDGLYWHIISTKDRSKIDNKNSFSWCIASFLVHSL